MIKYFCYLFLKRKGWRFESKLPDDLKSFVLIGAPHTSNYDFLPAMSLLYQVKRQTRFVIKDFWMKFPFSVLMKPIGGIGINREKISSSGSQSTTDLIADLFTQEKELVILISPEGTRKRTSKWKTGFYFIAQKANVPLVLAFADYKTRTIGVGEIIYPSDFNQDMEKIMKFYEKVTGKNPQHFSINI